MHVFEVLIKKDRKPDRTDFIWPKWWGEVVEQVDVVAYEDEGKDVEGAICVCDAKTWKLIAAKNDPAIRELSEGKANEKGRKWKPQREVVTDHIAAIKAAAKVARGEKLTEEEKKILDPDDPTPGVNRTPLFDIKKIIKEKKGGKA